MKVLLAILLTLFPAQLLAQDDPIRGRFLCDVLASRFVPADKSQAISEVELPRGYTADTTLIVDYTHDPGSGLTIYLGEPNRTNVLIEEPFPETSFKGISKITRKAEYRSTFSEVSLGKFSVNYKGNDQLNIKRSCSAGWSGHYVQTYVSGRFIQVVSLECRPLVNAAETLLARLKLYN